jgi:hypothetical protein
MRIDVCGRQRAGRYVSFETRPAQRIFKPSRHLFQAHISEPTVFVPLMALRVLCAVVDNGKKSYARRVCRCRDCRRSRGSPENIRKPYAKATVPVLHTNSMRGDSYYCRGLSSSVVAALSAENENPTLLAGFRPANPWVRRCT